MTGVVSLIYKMFGAISARWFSRLRPTSKEIAATAVNPPEDPKIFAKKVLQSMSACYPKIYAVVHLFSFRFHITRNDLIVCHRMKGVQIGDILRLNRVIELGTEKATLKGRPWVNPDYYHIEACVMDHGKGERIRSRLPYKRKGIRRERYAQPLTTTLRIRDIKIQSEKQQ